MPTARAAEVPVRAPVRRHWPLLVLVLAAAAALRFAGLAWNLRHPPHVDEEPFVRWTLVMLRQGDLDHRYYEYPGLLFYLLAPVLAFFQGGGAGAYLAARGLVAGFGVASVFLVYRLGSAVGGARTGLIAAALLAVSPTEVRVAHMVRPDVVLGSFALLALLTFRRVGERLRGDVVAAVALGAATAVKFTGVLLAPAYLVRRRLQPGFGWRRLVAAGLVAPAAFVALSPYTVLHSRGALDGAVYQASWHYAHREGAQRSYWNTLGEYGGVIARGLGWPGALLALAGMLLRRRDWRRWADLAVLPVAAVLVLSTADVRRLRFMVLAMGALAVLAAMALDRLAERSRALAAPALLLVIGVPAASSAAYSYNLTRPTTKDALLDWVEARVPAGARILLTWPADVGLDPARYEVVRVDHLDEAAFRLALHADFVLCGPSIDGGPLLQRLRKLHEVLPASRDSGPRLQVRQAPAELRPAYAPVPLGVARLTASSGGDGLERLRDGRHDASWEAAPGRERWVQVDLAEPRRLARIELQPGQAFEADPLQVWVSGDCRRWQPVATVRARPQAERQLGVSSDVLLLVEPAMASSVRLVRSSRGPWAFAELRLEALAAEPGAAAPMPRLGIHAR